MRAGEASASRVYTMWTADLWPNHTAPGYSHTRAAGKFSKVLKEVVLSHVDSANQPLQEQCPDCGT